MHIRRFSLIAISLYTTVMPAYAQGYAKDKPMVNTSHLQPVTFFKYRPMVRIDDESPIVTVGPRTRRSPLIIPIPPMENDDGGGMQVPAGAVPIGNGMFAVPGSPGGIGSSNPMLGDRSYLQDAGPRSHIRQQPFGAGGNLPAGFNTGIHGQMKAPNMVSGNAGPSPMRANFSKPTSNMAGEPVTFKYDGPSVSVGGHSSSHVTTSTSLKMLGKIK